MGKLREENARYGRAPVHQWQLGATSVRGSSSTTSSAARVQHIHVATADWQTDSGSGSPVTPTYFNAPAEGSIVYVDIAHNLGSDEATAVSFRDETTDRRFTGFYDQIPLSDSTLRVWMASTPTNDITIKVVA